jgi:hypothetical protein
MVNEAAIRESAYHLWKQAGEPEGEDLRFWLAAEQELDCCGDMTSEDAELGKGPDKAGSVSVKKSVPSKMTTAQAPKRPVAGAN